MLFPAYASSTEARASFTWRKSGSASPGQQQRDPTPGAHTSDTHNFDRDIAQFVTIQKNAAIFLQRFAVSGKCHFYALEKLHVFVPSPMKNEWRVILNLRQSADDLSELRKIMFNHAAIARIG